MKQQLRSSRRVKAVYCRCPIFWEWLIEKSGECRKEVLDISSPLTDGGSAIIDDSFLRCFTSMPPDNWNWNLYLFPLWCIGVVVRHCVLFPLRLFLLLSGFVVFVILFFSVRLFLKVSHGCDDVTAEMEGV